MAEPAHKHLISQTRDFNHLELKAKDRGHKVNTFKYQGLRSLTHAPEIGAISLNSMADSSASFSCRCTTSNVVDCLRAPKAVNDVRSRASARKTGAGIWHRTVQVAFTRPDSS